MCALVCTAVCTELCTGLCTVEYWLVYWWVMLCVLVCTDVCTSVYCCMYWIVYWFVYLCVLMYGLLAGWLAGLLAGLLACWLACCGVDADICIDCCIDVYTYVLMVDTLLSTVMWGLMCIDLHCFDFDWISTGAKDYDNWCVCQCLCLLICKHSEQTSKLQCPCLRCVEKEMHISIMSCMSASHVVLGLFVFHSSWLMFGWDHKFQKITDFQHCQKPHFSKNPEIL